MCVCVTYTFFFSALKSKEILTHAPVWMNIADIMLSKIKLVVKGQMLYDFTYVKKFT
jgi:hypothetical protein